MMKGQKIISIKREEAEMLTGSVDEEKTIKNTVFGDVILK
jgi:hypothetical protein